MASLHAAMAAPVTAWSIRLAMRPPMHPLALSSFLPSSSDASVRPSVRPLIKMTSLSPRLKLRCPHTRTRSAGHPFAEVTFSAPAALVSTLSMKQL